MVCTNTDVTRNKQTVKSVCSRLLGHARNLRSSTAWTMDWC